jgi:hypothetical protein
MASPVDLALAALDEAGKQVQSAKQDGTMIYHALVEALANIDRAIEQMQSLPGPVTDNTNEAQRLMIDLSQDLLAMARRHRPTLHPQQSSRAH